MTELQAKISGIGWVLPAGTGTGLDILSRPDWLEPDPTANAALEKFSARPYLSSVKGYLDPASACCLAAAALALEKWDRPLDGSVREDVGICALTQYGAPQSGFRFYAQFVEKGPRFVSPLVFPHSYSSAAGNLAAIEFGFGGPHMVFYGPPDPAAAVDFALTQLAGAHAADMLITAFETAPAVTVPDGTRVLNGGITVWLSSRPDAPELTRVTVPVSAQTGQGKDASVNGSVHAMMQFLLEQRGLP